MENSKPNSTIVEESNNNENYITEEVTEEVLVKLLCNVGVLEESKSDPDPELTPILANPPHSVPLTTTTPQNNLNLKVTEFKPVTKKQNHHHYWIYLSHYKTNPHEANQRIDVHCR